MIPRGPHGKSFTSVAPSSSSPHSSSVCSQSSPLPSAQMVSVQNLQKRFEPGNLPKNQQKTGHEKTTTFNEGKTTEQQQQLAERKGGGMKKSSSNTGTGGGDGVEEGEEEESSSKCANLPLMTTTVDCPSMASSSTSFPPPLPSSQFSQEKKPPKPKVPPKPTKLTATWREKKPTEEDTGKRPQNWPKEKEEKENGPSTKTTTNPPSIDHHPSSMPCTSASSSSPCVPFNRANSIRRPKFRPPVPAPSSAASTSSQTKVDEKKKNADGNEKGILPPHSIIRKPSARPPPPPAQMAKLAHHLMSQSIPKLPSNPPPPPPASLTSSLPHHSHSAVPPPPPSTSLIGGSIYEEIEADGTDQQPMAGKRMGPIQGGNGWYTPKFRKKEGGGGGGAEWPPKRRKKAAERRRTTQLEVIQLWKEEEGSRRGEGGEGPMGRRQNFDDDDDDEMQQKEEFLSHISSRPGAILCHSMFIPSSQDGTLNRTDFGRIGAGLRHNLAKGMVRLRSRVSAFSSSAAAASPSAVAKSFLPNNFRTLTLGRTKSERIGQIGEAGGRSGRTKSTFYLDGRGEKREMEDDEDDGKRPSWEEEGENSSSELFGDDWSSSEEEEEEGEEVVEEEQQKIKRMNNPEEEEDRPPPPPPPLPAPSIGHHPQRESFLPQINNNYNNNNNTIFQSPQSLLAEIESEYQRLQLNKRRKKKEEQMENMKLDESPATDQQQEEGEEEQHHPVAVAVDGCLFPSASTQLECPSANDEDGICRHLLPSSAIPFGPSPLSANFSSTSSSPLPFYNSKLAEQQPLYQILLLQQDQQQHLGIAEEGPFIESEEGHNKDKGTDGDQRMGSKQQMEKEEIDADSACPADCSSGDSSEGSAAGGSRSCTSTIASSSAAVAASSSSSSSTSAAAVEAAAAICHSPLHSIVRRNSSSTTTDSGRANSLPHRPLRRERLLGQSIHASQRSLWCELPEVKESGLLESMDEEEKKQQEAYFEVITSEASYLRSISFLISHFMSAPELLGSSQCSASVITVAERKQLFSNILAIRDCSEHLLSELESRLKQGFVLTDICDILCTHFESHFEPYVNYCSNQVYQDRTLKKLKTDNPFFVGCVQRLEMNRQCAGLDMRSFLMLPMQRITRYPLLIDAILLWLHPDQHQHSVATRALTLANQVVRSCNEGARRMERTEQMVDIESRLVYKNADLKRVPLVSNGRYVVKSGQLMQMAEKGANKPKLGTSRGLKARPLAFFLFNDLLMIAKRRLNGQFVCKDYAYRRFVVLEPMEVNNLRVPPGVQSAIGMGRSPHLLSCVLLQNARGRQVELLLSAESESDRERWLSAMRPPTCANPDEKIYAEWDCPQALAVHNYEPAQADELGLSPGDLVNILRKMSDGWYYGERIRDKKGGWFPSSYVQQVMNDHVRAQNYRERLKIMQSASDYRSTNMLQQQQQGGGKRGSLASPFSASPSSSSQQTSSSTRDAPILGRFRRLSNPRAYFT